MMKRIVEGASRIFLARGYTDFRKQIPGLVATVTLSFKLDPYNGSYVFIFCNRRRDSIKVLRYDQNGFVLATKKLLDDMKLQCLRKADEIKESLFFSIQRGSFWYWRFSKKSIHKREIEMKEKYRNFFWFTVIPFLIPFISDLRDEWMCWSLKWGIIICAIVIDFYFSFKTLKTENDNRKEIFIEKAVRYAYSYAHELMESKRDTLSHDLEFEKVDLERNILPYDIHLRIIDICRQFKHVVSLITQINSEYVTCTLIYRYSFKEASKDERSWKWAAGRDPIDKLNLNRFVTMKDTSYYHIINNRTNFVYIPRKDEMVSKKDKKHPEDEMPSKDKKVSENEVVSKGKMDSKGEKSSKSEVMYHLGNRDKMYNNKGSAFSIKIAFGNNETPLVEGILTVSTYGKYFTEEMDLDDADDVFQRMMVDEIFPYYKKLFEMEFGMLYLRHIEKKKAVDISQ